MKRWLIVKLSGKEGSSLPAGYWVKGYGLMPRVGKPIFLRAEHAISKLETSKNEDFDWFSTTEVKEVDMTCLFRGEFTTQNSVWSFKEI